MLILVTSEESNSAEKEQLIHFFENGLPLLHVRKTAMTEDQLKAWLSQFEEKQLQKMVLHQHHHLAEKFPVKGIHLKESFRKELRDTAQYAKRFRSNGLIISSSFHDLEAVKKEGYGFDYLFLSPVFSSVSKKGYEGQAFNVESLPHKIVALGGIESDKIPKTKDLGYAGVAVLGAVWLAENKKQAFTEISNKYSNVYQ